MWKSVSLNLVNVKLISIQDKTQNIDWSYSGVTTQIAIAEGYDRFLLILHMQDIGIHGDRYPQTGEDRYPGKGGDRYPPMGKNGYPTAGKDRYPYKGDSSFSTENVYIWKAESHDNGRHIVLGGK